VAIYSHKVGARKVRATVRAKNKTKIRRAQGVTGDVMCDQLSVLVGGRGITLDKALYYTPPEFSGCFCMFLIVRSESTLLHPPEILNVVLCVFCLPRHLWTVAVRGAFLHDSTTIRAGLKPTQSQACQTPHFLWCGWMSAAVGRKGSVAHCLHRHKPIVFRFSRTNYNYSNRVVLERVGGP
jgi:hypothetical protein